MSVSGLKVSELKKILHNAHIDTSDCIEKLDLVRKVEELHLRERGDEESEIKVGSWRPKKREKRSSRPPSRSTLSPSSGKRTPSPDQDSLAPLPLGRQLDRPVHTPKRTSGVWLHVAAQEGKEMVVSMMLRSGRCEVSDKDEEGRTALHRAAAAGHLGVVKLLVDAHHADTSVTDNEGKTASDVAEAAGMTQCYLYLTSLSPSTPKPGSPRALGSRLGSPRGAHCPTERHRSTKQKKPKTPKDNKGSKVGGRGSSDKRKNASNGKKKRSPNQRQR